MDADALGEADSEAAAALEELRRRLAALEVVALEAERQRAEEERTSKSRGGTPKNQGGTPKNGRATSKNRISQREVLLHDPGGLEDHFDVLRRQEQF